MNFDYAEYQHFSGDFSIGGTYTRMSMSCAKDDLNRFDVESRGSG